MKPAPLSQKLLTLALGLGCLVNLGLFMARANQPQPQGNVFMASYGHTQPIDNSNLIASIEPKSSELFGPRIMLPPAPSQVSVPLDGDGKSLLLNATVNNRETGRFILDTGATYTTISRATAQRLGYDLVNCEHITITTANGQVSIPKITLRSLTLNGYTAYNVQATVMTMPSNVSFSGLLGLSFVKNRRITIDSANQRLVIESPAVPVASATM